MASISKRVSGSWVSGDERIMKTATDTITSLPSDLYADGTNATVGLVGNMSQTGTPSPSSPIQPSECGEMTGNLFDKSTITTGSYATTSGTSENNSYYCSDFIPITATTYYIQNAVGGGYQNTIVVYDSNKQGLRYAKLSGGVQVSGAMTFQDGDAYIRVNCYYQTDVDTVMVNIGSTALPYQPHGYKIPILCGNTTTNVYLGEVQSTRKIVKTVLTSSTNVDWAKSSSRNYAWYFSPTAIGVKANTPFLCSHGATVTSVSDYIYGTVYCDNTVNLGIFPSTLTNVSSLKNWLDEQNANGTPVVIWNVLTTPTTGIVNEPLRKIGDYADTVSGITIPTITGADTFDVLTTLKPSEVSLNYTGWHDATVKEWDGSEWQ